jgi:hypothetical protein
LPPARHVLTPDLEEGRVFAFCPKEDWEQRKNGRA